MKKIILLLCLNALIIHSYAQRVITGINETELNVFPTSRKATLTFKKDIPSNFWSLSKLFEFKPKKIIAFDKIKNQKCELEFNNNGLLIKQSYYYNDKITSSTTLIYNFENKIISETKNWFTENSKIIHSYQYDNSGNLVSEKKMIDGKMKFTIEYRYNKYNELVFEEKKGGASYYKAEYLYNNGLLVEMKVFDDSTSNESKTFVFKYHNNDLIFAGMKDADAYYRSLYNYNYEYNSNHELTKKISSNNVVEFIYKDGLLVEKKFNDKYIDDVTYSYNQYGDISSITYGESVSSTFMYEYDTKGNWISYKKYNSSGKLVNHYTRQFFY